MTVTTPNEKYAGRRGTGLIAILLVIEVFAVTETAMAFAAIPTFMREFQADAALVGWTTTAYLLVGAGFAATAGRLGDIFGRHKILTLVLVGSAFGSLVSMVAVDLWMIILGRGLQGLSAGAIPISFALMRELLPARRVPLSIALLGGVIPISAGIGSLLAGVLLDLQGWRLMFAVALVLGILASVTSHYGVPKTEGLTPRPQVDGLGALLLLPATAGVLFGVSKGNSWGWTSPGVLGSIGLGLIALAVWVWWELRTREPIVDVRQFKSRKVALTTIATILISMGPMGAVTLLTPMVLQLPKETSIGFGLSPTTAGVLSLIKAIICYSAAFGSGWIAQKVGARWALVGACALYIVGTGLWFFSTDSLVLTLIFIGFLQMGSNASLPALANLIVEAVPAAQTGAATGMNRVTMNVGVATGTAVTSVILSLWLVPGTTLPTEQALSAAFAFIIGTSLVSLLLALLIGGRRPAAADAQPSGAGAKEAAV